MHRIIFLLFLVISIKPFCQVGSTECKPDAEIKVNICGGNFLKTSICPACYECRPRLLASDSNYIIISFKISAELNGEIEEVGNEGAFISNMETSRILGKLKNGDFVDFNCIKAKHNNGSIYTLQPLHVQIK